MYMLLNCYYSIIIPMPFLFLLRGSARMASSMDSVGKRCAAMEQGHRDLESHFVDFMPGPPGGRNGDGATAAARGTTWDTIFYWGGEIEKEPNNFMKHMIFGIFFLTNVFFFTWHK